jgi:hypothetical protein
VSHLLSWLRTQSQTKGFGVSRGRVVIARHRTFGSVDEMKHSIKHSLSQEMARKVTRKAFDSYKQRFADYNPTDKWVNEDKSEISFSAKGVSMKGVIELKPSEIQLELDVPFLFKVFQKKAISIIEEEIKKWIVKAEAGEVLSLSISIAFAP